MKKGILRKRLKGLLALSLAFYLMFGNGIQGLAAEYRLDEIADGKEFQIGDKIIMTENGKIHIDGTSYSVNKDDEYEIGDYLKVVQISGGEIYLELYTPTPDPTPVAPVSSSGGTHTHSLRWEIVQEPTETVDGRSEYRCECGHVEAAQPISFFGAIIKRIIKSIEEAPQNGTVVVENKFLRCLTDEIMEALHKRSDVNLEVKFSEQGVNYHFLIPATAAPTEEEEWFGYFYLGGRYGWLQ